MVESTISCWEMTYSSVKFSSVSDSSVSGKSPSICLQNGATMTLPAGTWTEALWSWWEDCFGGLFFGSSSLWNIPATSNQGISRVLGFRPCLLGGAVAATAAGGDAEKLAERLAFLALRLSERALREMDSDLGRS